MFNCSDAKFRAIPQKVASIYTYEFVTTNINSNAIILK